MRTNVDNPTLKPSFLAHDEVIYTLNTHSGLWIVTDVSANFNPGDIIQGFGYCYTAGGGNVGAREVGSTETPTINVGAQWVPFLVQVSPAGEVEFLDDAVLGLAQNVYRVWGILR